MNKLTTFVYAVFQKATDPRTLGAMLFLLPLVGGMLLRDVGGNPCGCTGG